MKTILICPGDRPAVAFLAQSVPLVNLPVLGEPLICHWLESLASSGASEVLVLATDRPEQVRQLIDSGTRWGIRPTVEALLQELTPEQAQAQYGPLGWDGPAFVIDRLPDSNGAPLFASYKHWFRGVQSCLGKAPSVWRLGFRQLRPGVWVGRRTQISDSAQLKPPCWIGANVHIGSHAIVGPNAVLEDCVVVETAAEIVDSIVGPETFVGALTKVQSSIAWGSTLIDWRSSSCTVVPDAFLLSPLSQRNGHGTHPSWSELWNLALSRVWQCLTRKARS